MANETTIPVLDLATSWESSSRKGATVFIERRSDPEFGIPLEEAVQMYHRMSPQDQRRPILAQALTRDEIANAPPSVS